MVGPLVQVAAGEYSGCRAKAAIFASMRVHHLAFRTDHLPRLERFYVAGLGLTVISRQDERSVWLEAGGTILMLERREPNEPPLLADSQEVVAFAVSPQDFPPLWARLAASGVSIENRTDFTVYCRDPDGRKIGLSAYPVALERLPGG